LENLEHLPSIQLSTKYGTADRFNPEKRAAGKK
jgi:hypothetical protein